MILEVIVASHPAEAASGRRTAINCGFILVAGRVALHPLLVQFERLLGLNAGARVPFGTRWTIFFAASRHSTHVDTGVARVDA